MKLFLLSQNENSDYDTYDSFVVCAPDENTARQTYPGYGKWGDTFASWCSSPDKVTVQYIGDAAPDLPLGVVCASFNAG